MKNKEDELLSVQYRIEKSGMKQQKLEKNLATISKELKKSKRNSLIFMIFFITVIAGMAGGMYYLSTKNTGASSEPNENATELDVDQVQKINDSLRQKIVQLKSEIEAYRSSLDTSDSIENELADSSDIAKSELHKLADSDTIKKLKFERKHCFVKKVFRKNGVIFIEADFVSYFEGKKAVEKAKENNEAEYDIDKDGDTLYFLYDNYYLYNANTNVRRLEINDKARVQGINQISNGFPLKAFENSIADNPIMVLEINDGIIYKISRQKLP